MPVILTDVRAAFDEVSRLTQSPLTLLHAAVVAQCRGDQEPVFGATARLLESVCSLKKAIAADIPSLIDDAEAVLSNAASATPPRSEDAGI